MSSWIRLIVIVVSTMMASAGHTEPVAINRGDGQGYAVDHRNNCYILLPVHVLGRSNNLTLSAGAPPVVGEARVFQRFNIDDMDLAVAVVSGTLQGRCDSRFSDLPRRIDELLGNARPLSLVRVAPSGIVTREPVEVTEVLYETLRIRTVADTRDLTAGSSGSFLFSDDIPVAMLTDAIDPGNGIALRMDAIVSRISRLLEGGPTVGDRADPIGSDRRGRAVDRQSDAVSRESTESIALRVVACQPEPVDPDFACGRLVEAEGAMLMPAGQPIRVDMEIEWPQNASRSIRSVSLRSVVDGAGAYAVPKSVLIEIDSSTGETRRWRPFAAGDMSPLGEFDAAPGVGQFAERLRLHITSSWSDHLDHNLPTRLDRVTVR